MGRLKKCVIGLRKKQLAEDKDVVYDCGSVYMTVEPYFEMVALTFYNILGKERYHNRLSKNEVKQLIRLLSKQLPKGKGKSNKRGRTK